MSKIGASSPNTHLFRLEKVLVDGSIFAQHLRGRQEAPEGDRASDSRVVVRVGGLWLFFFFSLDGRIWLSVSVVPADFECLPMSSFTCPSPRERTAHFDLTSRAMRLASKASKTGRDAISRKGGSRRTRKREKCVCRPFLLRRFPFRRKIFLRGDQFFFFFLLLHFLFAYVSGRRPPFSRMMGNDAALPFPPSSYAAAAHSLPPKTRLELEELVDSLSSEVRL